MNISRGMKAGIAGLSLVSSLVFSGCEMESAASGPGSVSEAGDASVTMTVDTSSLPQASVTKSAGMSKSAVIADELTLLDITVKGKPVGVEGKEVSQVINIAEGETAITLQFSAGSWVIETTDHLYNPRTGEDLYNTNSQTFYFRKGHIYAMSLKISTEFIWTGWDVDSETVDTSVTAFRFVDTQAGIYLDAPDGNYFIRTATGFIMNAVGNRVGGGVLMKKAADFSGVIEMVVKGQASSAFAQLLVVLTDQNDSYKNEQWITNLTYGNPWEGSYTIQENVSYKIRLEFGDNMVTSRVYNAETGELETTQVYSVQLSNRMLGIRIGDPHIGASVEILSIQTVAE